MGHGATRIAHEHRVEPLNSCPELEGVKKRDGSVELERHSRSAGRCVMNRPQLLGITILRVRRGGERRRGEDEKNRMSQHATARAHADSLLNSKSAKVEGP